MVEFVLRPVGHVQSRLTDLSAAPRQADEQAPQAWLVLDPKLAAAAEGLSAGDDIVVVTWLDRGSRDVHAVHPRGDEARRVTGVFATRAPHRPNPIGLHTVRITEIVGWRILVDGLEALNGTPILDIKPVLGPIETR